MLQERRLGAPALEAINAHMHHEWGHGWSLSIGGRRDGESLWMREDYHALSTPELSDVVGLVLSDLLGL